MKLKRLIVSLILCASVLAMALPVSAASSFHDISDPNTAVNADVLRLMGVVSGSGGNNFSPDANLTRAEFCVMAVKVMGLGDQVPLHTTRTIFRDVTARHWARGYINLAASITVNGSKEDQVGGRLISGTGNGQFNPDAHITYAQAVTILMRMLGYSDQQAGSVWPAGYMNLANALSLTQGINASSHSPITRAQAAQLFVNLLSTKTNAGQTYADTLGSTTEHVLLLAVNVTGDDGLPGAIRTSKGTYHSAVQGVVPSGLQGRRGTLLLNDRSEILTFIPDQSTAVTLTLAGDAQAASLKSTDGIRYSIAASTPAFTSNTENGDSTYGTLWTDLRAGAQVTLFLEGGKVIGVYYAAGGLSSTQAYVVTDTLNSASFHPLTGGATNYTIKKDNEPIQLSQVQLYDVATYDAVTNTVVISDLRLNCVYEHASPNPETPTSITVLGHQFPVLESALDSISSFKIGDSVSLLLTADGAVAGMVKPGSKTRSTATGLAGSSSVTVDLPNGQSIELKGDVPEDVQDRVVTVTATKGDRLNATRISGTSVPGDFNLTDMTLGSHKVAAGVRVYEQVGSSAMVPLNLAALDVDRIPAQKLSAYHQNTSGFVDIIVLNAVTGDSYTYGIMHEGSVTSGTGELDVTNRTIAIENASGGQTAVITGSTFKDGSFGGAVIGAREIGGTRVAAGVVELTGISGVTRSDFFVQDGIWYVTAEGTVYPISPNVECYKPSVKEWLPAGMDGLSAIRQYSNSLTVYVDPIGEKVRIITAK